MSRSINRRIVLSGFALPAIAGLGLSASPALASPRQVPGPGLPDPGLPDPGIPDVGLPTFTEATHDTVLTQATADALAGRGIRFLPAPGSTAVEGAAQPSTQVPLSVGTAALDLLTGAVAFDGGFALADAAEGGRELMFGSFTSQLADSVASSWLWVDGEPGDRIPALSYDMLTSTIELDGTNLRLRDYDLFLTPEAVEAIQAVFPDAPVTTEEPFATGSALGTFVT